MRILILSCNTGEGHNSSAKAIKQYAEANGSTCDIKDALSYWPAGTSKFICSGHVLLYKNAPELFGVGYRFFELQAEKKVERERENPDKNYLSDAILPIIVKYPSEKLYEDIEKGGYDAIISVHVFASLMLTEIRQNHGYLMKMYFVATDYTCSPGVNLSDFDACFTPDEKLTSEFTGLGIDPEKIVPTGIPVREEFYTRTDAAVSKRHLGIPENKRLVLMMSGSMGCGPIKEIVELLADELPSDTVAAVICGRNEKLAASLSKIKNKNNLFIIGYTTEISGYMDAAELIITKPGGLSSTEAATKHLPIVFFDAVPGCESHNIDFYKRYGFAEIGEDPEDVIYLVNTLLRSPDRLKAMKESMKNSFTHRSAKEIYEYVLGDYNG